MMLVLTPSRTRTPRTTPTRRPSWIMNNDDSPHDTISERCDLFQARSPPDEFSTEQFRNSDRKTTFKVVNFDEHNFEAALGALERLIDYCRADVRYGHAIGQRQTCADEGPKNSSSSTGRTHNSTLAQRDDANDRWRNGPDQLLPWTHGVFRKGQILQSMPCLPSEYISRYKDLFDYVPNLNGTLRRSPFMPQPG